jgi:hypothetical protein
MNAPAYSDRAKTPPFIAVCLSDRALILRTAKRRGEAHLAAWVWETLLETALRKRTLEIVLTNEIIASRAGLCPNSVDHAKKLLRTAGLLVWKSAPDPETGMMTASAFVLHPTHWPPLHRPAK